MKIALDIGHARNTGALGNGLEEHAVASKIVEHLAQLLQSSGHFVAVLDYPDKSNSEDINETIKAANAGNYDIGVSIHCDCSDNPDAHGAHVCFYPGSVQGEHLAASIAELLSGLMPGRANTTQARANLAILKQTKATWVLCECGFISHAGDADLIKHHPESIANAIAQGINAYTLNQ